MTMCCFSCWIAFMVSWSIGTFFLSLDIVCSEAKIAFCLRNASMPPYRTGFCCCTGGFCFIVGETDRIGDLVRTPVWRIGDICGSCIVVWVNIF